MVYYGTAFNAGSLAGNIFLNNFLGKQSFKGAHGQLAYPLYAVSGGIFEMSFYLICAFTMNYFGRRLLMAVTLVGSGLALLANAIINEFATGSESKLFSGLVLDGR